MGVSAMVLFDTNRLVKQLKVAGFRISTAVHLCNLIKEVVGPAVGCVSAQSVTRSVFEQEINKHIIETQKQIEEIHERQAQLTKSRKDSIVNLIKDLRTHQLRSREALASIRSERRLELCIERSRGRDDMTGTAMRFQEFCNDVDGDRGNCEAALGKLRHDVLYSLVGFFFTGAAALFGFLRLFSR